MRIFLVIITVLSTTFLYAQRVTFGEVTVEELESSSDPLFPDANAELLYMKVVTSVGKSITVHQRFKIFNKEGYDYAQVRIPYPDVYRLKGATYNLINGEVIETKLDKDLVYTDEEVKGVKIKKISFPNVSPGSVLELTYKSENGTLADIDLQYDIPVKRIAIEVRNESRVDLEVLQNPRALIDLNRNENVNSINISAKNVPPLEKESHIYDMEMYRAKLSLNIVAIGYSVTLNSWEEYAKQLFQGGEFERQLASRGFYKDDMERVIAGETTDLGKAEKIYTYIKNEINWNEESKFYPKTRIREVYKDKTGSDSDINALYISMLKSVGIDAHPVLVSSKSNGISLRPSYHAFDCMITAIKVKDEYHLKEVANHESSFTMLPESLIYWKGMLVEKRMKPIWIDLTNIEHSVIRTVVSAEITEDLTIEGKLKDKKTGYYAIELKNQTKDNGAIEIEQLFKNRYTDVEIIDVSVKDGGMDEVFSEFTFDIENRIDQIGDKLYFSPLLFLGMEENPFKKEDRKYPIDFGYPKQLQSTISVSIPANYKIESIPEPIKLSLPRDIGFFTYIVAKAPGGIQILTKFQINTPLLPNTDYLALKEFFNVLIAKEQEKVVLVKI
jgi:hypothetical protein